MLTIHREKQPDRLIRMGQAPVVIESPTVTAAEADEYFAERMQSIPDAPPEPVKNKQGRKQMAKEKDLSEAGTETIRKDDAGEQGAIGSHGQNAPAQTKVPDKPQGSEQGKEK